MAGLHTAFIDVSCAIIAFGPPAVIGAVWLVIYWRLRKMMGG